MSATLKRKADEEFVQRTTTDFEKRTTDLCWDIKEFGSMAKSANALGFKKTVTLIKHSLKCDLQFSTSAVEHDKCTSYKNSLMKVRLYSYEGKGARLMVSVALRRYTQNFTSEKKLWNMSPLTDKVELDFTMPPRIRKSTDYWSKSWEFCDYFCVDDILTIHILFEEIIEIHQIEDQSLSLTETPLITLANFSELYTKRLFVDVTFTFPNNQLLYAHAVVLANACPYFLAMFATSNMQEASTRTVNMCNDECITFEIFKGFLDYVYGVKKLQEMDNIIKGLCILADKYNLSQLRQECEIVLCSSLHESNLASFLLFAHQYNFQILKQKILHLAKAHGMNAFKDLDEFREICNIPALLKELISFIQD
ncbi:hypothetical protein QAD02_015320 [Eretmocerus hayati]|uniref:Uncharacterized protein n=1 Tax=Eretmocerus hayati TaxID=131215 RepID=A0ACC2P8W0_9HYME|nr:hypothetical protein QAD02_015320 [Eretmocerus hayati]